VVVVLSTSPQLPASKSGPEVVGGSPTDPGQSPIQGVNPGLASALKVLEATGLPWVLLRGESDLLRPAGDVDVLVSLEMLPGLDELLEGVGFRRVLAWGHGSHRFYFRYLPDEDFWLKLDIVSDISFGQFQELKTALAEGCLRRRVSRGPLRLPEGGDQAWLQILHLLLDKGEIAPEREQTARTAGALASVSDPIAAFFDRRMGAGTAEALLDLFQAGRFDEIPAMAAAMKTHWMGRGSSPRLISFANHALRRLGPRLKGRGPVVGALAPDGAGKTTMLHGLRSHCPLPSAYVYMGLWASSRHDGWVQRIPGGVIARKLFRILRGGVVARYQSVRGRLVLLDRLAQDAMLAGAQRKSRLGGITDALALHLQPRPGLVLVLDAPGELMFARKGEHTPEVLEEWRHSYLDLAAELSAAHIIDASMSASTVRREASGLLWKVFSGERIEAAADVEPLPLQQWMLLDWRFMLPLGTSARLGYGGSLSPEAIEAISLLDPHAKCIDPDSGSQPVAAFDAVLLSHPALDVFKGAVVTLRPNGWMCVQVRRTFGFAPGPHTLVGWKRTLERTGFDDVAVYWNVPALERTERLVPTASVSAVQDTLSHYSDARFGKAKAAVARLALILGLFNFAAAEGTVVGRCAGKAREQEPR
jgi:hypothetical protein